MNRAFWPLSPVLAGLLLGALGSPALAVVGPALEDPGFSAHIVMVLNRQGDRAGFCSGVVVATRAVLTAAHCVTAPADMRVHYRDGAGGVVLLPVKTVVVHPAYRADALTRRVASIDLALVETESALDGRFSAADLDATGAVAVGDPLRIVGYGVGREGEGKTGGVLRAAALRVRAPLSGTLLWAEDPEAAGAGACTGDSGGPILSGDGAKVLAIVTWSAGVRGKRCGTVTQGPLVAAQRAWIEGVLAGWGR